MHNAPIYIMCLKIKNIMASAAEWKTGSIFMTVQRACPVCVTLIKLMHPQPPKGTPLYTEKSNAKGIITSYIRQNLSKAFNIRLYWVRDCIKQRKLDLIWCKGKTNKAEYFTKRHPPWHHKKMWYQYLHKALISQLALRAHIVRGCVTPTTVPP